MKEQKLLSYLSQFGNLPADSLTLLRDSLEFDVYQRGQILWKSGEKVDKIYFLFDGLIRLYFYNEQGDKITAHF